MDLPKDKTNPPGAGQCDRCGGHGCPVCGGRGWLPAGWPGIRRCEHCGAPLLPSHLAVYCSNERARADA